jgi:rhodanese-related sulfurtransferase
MSAESSSTIGRQRQTNYALRAGSRDEFVHLLTDNLNAAPEYFKKEVDLNRRGAAALSQLPPLAALSAADVERLQNEGAVVMDTRPTALFGAAHVPGSIHISLTGQYASWAARILGLGRPLIIVGEEPEQVRESQMRLARVGIETVVGFLEDGVVGWVKGGRKLETIPQLSAIELDEFLKQDSRTITVLDVREPGEVESGTIEDAVTIPLGKLEQNLDALDSEKLIVVNCRSGYRSSIATSILRRAGFNAVANLTGGLDAWKASGLLLGTRETVHA